MAALFGVGILYKFGGGGDEEKCRDFLHSKRKPPQCHDVRPDISFTKQIVKRYGVWLARVLYACSIVGFNFEKVNDEQLVRKNQNSRSKNPFN